MDSCFRDNLFNSRKLFTALYKAQALAHGVVRTHGRGFPSGVVQSEEKNVRKAALLRGATKAARLVNTPECPDLLAALVYDTKPVHILSTAADCIKWVEKKREMWSDITNEMTTIAFLWLNLIENYNKHMNSTDIADQIRNQYRPDHWMRNRKWWWAFFIWGLGVAASNAWKIYKAQYDNAKEDGEVVLPPKWSHRVFLEELVYDMLSPLEAGDHAKRLKEMDDDTIASFKSAKQLSAFSQSKKYVNDEEEYDFTCPSDVMRYNDDVRVDVMTKHRLNTGFLSADLMTKAFYNDGRT